MTDDCPGLTRAEIEANIITVLAQRGITGNDRDVTIELVLSYMVIVGHFKACSRHPDHYLLTRAGWAATKAAQARLEEEGSI